MEKLETEVKFYLNSIQSIRERLSDLGARSHGKFFERNLRYEDRQNNLKKKKQLLRLRQDKKNTLTVKSQVSDPDSQFKKMKELEVEVSDFDTMHHILKALGYHCEQIYEKWRETFVLAETMFCLDGMPFGDFLEIEGHEEDIKHYASCLGLQWQDRILFNYLEIFKTLRDDMKLKFKDVTFDNFRHVEVRIADYLNILKTDRGC